MIKNRKKFLFFLWYNIGQFRGDNMKKYLDIIDKFVKEMEYDKNSHFLGIYFYGSSLTGFDNDKSDIDLHVVFDDSDSTHIYRGIHYINGKRIEYFEKCINDLYLSVENDIKERNIAWYSILGCSMILYDKSGLLYKLQNYTKYIYINGLPKIDYEDTMELIAIINNRIEKLKIACDNDDGNFYNLYHLTIEKIRRLYHSIKGYPKINTSKIYKIYKNDEYRKTYYNGEFVSDEFKNMYFDLIEDRDRDKNKLLNNIIRFYDYVKDGINLPCGNYRIKIKSRNG